MTKYLYLSILLCLLYVPFRIKISEISQTWLIVLFLPWFWKTKWRKQVCLCDRGFLCCDVGTDILLYRLTWKGEKYGILLSPNCSYRYLCYAIRNKIIIIIIIIFGVEAAQVFWKYIRTTTEGGYGHTSVFRIHGKFYSTQRQNIRTWF